MTKIFNDENPEFGRYAGRVQGFIDWVTVLNPNNKNPNSPEGRCYCAVEVPDNYKDWTKKDLKIAATSPYGADAFDVLKTLADAAIKDEAIDKKKPKGPGNVQWTEDAKHAQAALDALKPTGKTRKEFFTMINEVYTENKAEFEKAYIDGTKWLIDISAINVKHNTLGELSAETLRGLTKTYRGVRAFNDLQFMVIYADQREFDLKANKSVPTELAKYARAKLDPSMYPLSEYNPEVAAKYKNLEDGKYQIFRDMFYEIEKETRAARKEVVFQHMLEEENKKEKQKEQKSQTGNAVGFSNLDVGEHNWLQTTAKPMDKETATAVLTQRGVNLTETSMDAVQALATMQAKKPAVVLAA